MDGDVRVVCQIVVILVAQHGGQHVFPVDGLCVMPFFSRLVAVCEALGFVGLMDEGLGRNAADIDAGTAVHFVGTFDHGDFPVPFGEIDGERFAAFSESDNDGIDFFHFAFLFFFLFNALARSLCDRNAMLACFGKGGFNLSQQQV